MFVEMKEDVRHVMAVCWPGHGYDSVGEEKAAVFVLLGSRNTYNWSAGYWNSYYGGSFLISSSRT